jgi:hypothetical protein
MNAVDHGYLRESHMKNDLMLKLMQQLSAIITASAVVWLLTTGGAAAAFLYWGKTSVHTSNLGECHSFANEAMGALNVQHIRVSPDEVAGTSGAAYAAITCVGTNPVTAIIMVVGDDGNETSSLRDSLQQKIAGIIKFD